MTQADKNMTQMVSMMVMFLNLDVLQYMYRNSEALTKICRNLEVFLKLPK